MSRPQVEILIHGEAVPMMDTDCGSLPTFRLESMDGIPRLSSNETAMHITVRAGDSDQFILIDGGLEPAAIKAPATVAAGDTVSISHGRPAGSLNRPTSPETRLLESGRSRLGLTLMECRLILRWRHVAQGASRRRLFNQSTHSNVATSTDSKVGHALRCSMTSVLNNPMTLSASALS